MSGLWGQDKPEQKRAGGHGTGWLRSPQGLKVVRITSAEESLHAKWVEVTDADVNERSATDPLQPPNAPLQRRAVVDQPPAAGLETGAATVVNCGQFLLAEESFLIATRPSTKPGSMHRGRFL